MTTILSESGSLAAPATDGGKLIASADGVTLTGPPYTVQPEINALYDTLAQRGEAGDLVASADVTLARTQALLQGVREGLGNFEDVETALVTSRGHVIAHAGLADNDNCLALRRAEDPLVESLQLIPTAHEWPIIAERCGHQRDFPDERGSFPDTARFGVTRR